MIALLVVVALFALLGWAASRWGADTREPGELRWPAAGSGRDRSPGSGPGDPGHPGGPGAGPGPRPGTPDLVTHGGGVLHGYHPRAQGVTTPVPDAA